jgi:hypothetical protein
MIRLCIHARCDAPGCTRMTKATAVAEFGTVHVHRADGKLERVDLPGIRNIAFPPDVHGAATGWVERDGRVWCPEHAAATSPKGPPP